METRPRLSRAANCRDEAVKFRSRDVAACPMHRAIVHACTRAQEMQITTSSLSMEI